MAADSKRLMRQIRETPPDPDMPGVPAASGGSDLPQGWELGPDGKPRRKAPVKVQQSVDDLSQFDDDPPIPPTPGPGGY